MIRFHVNSKKVNLLMVTHGICGGWMSPTIELLTSDKSPLESGKITMEEASWVASIICIGGLIGNILFGIMTNHFGRKVPLLFTAIPSIVRKINMIIWN